MLFTLVLYAHVLVSAQLWPRKYGAYAWEISRLGEDRIATWRHEEANYTSTIIRHVPKVLLAVPITIVVYTLVSITILKISLAAVGVACVFIFLGLVSGLCQLPPTFVKRSIQEDADYIICSNNHLGSLNVLLCGKGRFKNIFPVKTHWRRYYHVVSLYMLLAQIITHLLSEVFYLVESFNYNYFITFLFT